MEKASILLTKAHARYDEGVRVAARTQWVGSVTDRLKAKRDALADRLPQPSSGRSRSASTILRKRSAPSSGPKLQGTLRSVPTAVMVIL